MSYSCVSEIFKIGIGPSSSHTLGPWRICLDACERLEEAKKIQNVKTVSIHLYGSLAKTGEGHCTPMGCIMGLSGYLPNDTDPDEIDKILENIEKAKILNLFGKYPIEFSKKDNILFHFDESLEYHSNGMTLEITLRDDKKLMFTYYSIGGGFFIRDELKREKLEEKKGNADYPYNFSYAKDFLKAAREKKKNLYELILDNEKEKAEKKDLFQNIDLIVDTMLQSAYRGTRIDGVLPGSLGVKRRAKELNRQLLSSREINSMKDWHEAIAQDQNDFQKTLQWVSCIAISVNEENAACGRIVTAPTNGSSGTIPAALHYYLFLLKDDKKPKDVRRFISIASLVGSLFRSRATISAAEGGCQAEIGVSSAMAAAALTDALGGSPEQTFIAAEIAMEHHLGLTCDPIGGLVQVPCIERNALGAIKAITSSMLAIDRDVSNVIVDLDNVVSAMWETSKAMNAQYKETAEGGLALVLRNC